jgi:hypothetical protein
MYVIYMSWDLNPLIHEGCLLREVSLYILKIQRVQDKLSSLSCMIQRGAPKSSEPNTQNPASDPESLVITCMRVQSEFIVVLPIQNVLVRELDGINVIRK